MRNIQIGVMGSTADLDYSSEIEKIAEEVGENIARQGAILFFGAEKDFDSLSTAACRGAKKYGGLTVGVTYGKRKDILQQNVDVIVPTGLERGGGREFVLSLCGDALIAISGGSGTLNEMLVAYQADIPIVGIKGTGGTSSLFLGKSFDGRRPPIYEAGTPKEAVDIAMEVAKEYVARFK